MASKVLLKKIMALIEPGRDLKSLSKEEFEELEADALEILETVEDHQATTQRIIVVGQIQYKDDEEPFTVALGPYSARGVLSDPEKFKRAAESHTAAHENGGKLAWDTRTGRGRGRYMVVPVLRTARDAWDFYRGAGVVDLDELDLIINNFTNAMNDDPVEILPSCTCGLRASSGHQSVMGVPVTRKCYRHNVEK